MKYLGEEAYPIPCNPRYVLLENGGRIFNTKTGRELKFSILRGNRSRIDKPYRYLGLTNLEGKFETHIKGYWMLYAKTGERPPFGDNGKRMEVSHINDDSMDDTWDNLKWETHKENLQRGTFPGKSPGVLDVGKHVARLMIRLVNMGMSQIDVAEIWDRKACCVNNIVNGRRYAKYTADLRC